MQAELQEAIEAIASSCEYEELCATVINFAAQQSALKEIVDRAADGEIREDDANLAIAQAIKDHAQAQLDIFDLEIEVELDEKMAEMSSPEKMEQFNSNTEVLRVILAAAIALDYEDPSIGIMAAAEASGLEPGQIQGIIDMKFTPDLPTGQAMAMAFPSLTSDPEAMADWMNVVEAAYSEAIADAEDDYEPISPEIARMAACLMRLATNPTKRRA